jgi:HlyD family secretion protein
MRDERSTPTAAARRRRRTWFVALCGALAVVTLGVVLTVRRPGSTEAAVIVVRRGTVARTLVLAGRVRAPARARVGASITGVVREVRARAGDHVVRGAILAGLDDASAVAALAQARATFAAAAAQARSTAEQATLAANQADRDLRRSRALFAQGAISARDLELSERAAAVARSEREVAQTQARSDEASPPALAEVARARAAVAAAAAQLALMRIIAPSAATVLSRDVEPGDVVVPGRVLFDLALDGETELLAYPREENLAELEVGALAVASADAFPEQTFTARVTLLAPVVDPAQGTVEIRLRVLEPPTYLRADMTVSINVEIARHDSALVLPLDHVRDAGGEAPWVVVERDGRAERRSVRVGLRGDGAVEILGGVREGERVLPVTVKPGDRVRVRYAGAAAVGRSPGGP